MRTIHSMTFEDAQFIYDNMTPDENEQQYEQDDDREPNEPQEDLNAECRWW